MKDAGIVIPALNEADSIGAVLDELINEGFQPQNICVVDNGSTDDTVKESQYYGVKVLSCERRGKGNAVKVGFEYLIQDSVDKFFTLDADFTYPAAAVKEGYHWLVELPSSVFVMDRQPLIGAMPLPNKVANLIINKWVSWVNPSYGCVTDICSGLWCFPRKAVMDMLPTLSSTGFTIEAEYYCKLNYAGYQMGSFPYTYRPRMGGEKKTKPLDALKIMKFVWDNRCA